MGSWKYPGVMSLTLEGFAVQVLAKDQPWLTPFVIEKFAGAWRRCGVESVAELRQHLAECPADLEEELEAAELGELQETIHAMLEVLEVEYKDLHKACR